MERTPGGLSIERGTARDTSPEPAESLTVGSALLSGQDRLRHPEALYPQLGRVIVESAELDALLLSIAGGLIGGPGDEWEITYTSLAGLSYRRMSARHAKRRNGNAQGSRGPRGLVSGVSGAKPPMLAWASEPGLSRRRTDRAPRRTAPPITGRPCPPLIRRPPIPAGTMGLL